MKKVDYRWVWILIVLVVAIIIYFVYFDSEGLRFSPTGVKPAKLIPTEPPTPVPNAKEDDPDCPGTQPLNCPSGASCNVRCPAGSAKVCYCDGYGGAACSCYGADPYWCSIECPNNNPEVCNGYCESMDCSQDPNGYNRASCYCGSEVLGGCAYCQCIAPF